MRQTSSKKRVQKGSVRNSNLCRLSLCYSCLSSYSFGEDRQGYLPYSRMAEEKKQETHLSILLVHFGKNVFKHVISNRHLFLSNFEKLLHFFLPTHQGVNYQGPENKERIPKLKIGDASMLCIEG